MQTPGPMVSFKSAHKTSHCFVRAKLYPIEKIVGSRQSEKRRCEVGNNEKHTFSSTVTGETFHISHKLKWDNKSLICLLKCTVCERQSTDAFQFRLNNYKDN